MSAGRMPISAFSYLAYGGNTCGHEKSCAHESWRTNVHLNGTPDNIGALDFEVYEFGGDIQRWNLAVLASRILDTGLGSSFGPKARDIIDKVSKRVPWDQLSSKAVANFDVISPFGQNVAVGNFILELRELITMAAKWNTKRSVMKSISNLLRESKSVPAAALTLLADLLLEFQFGLSAFITDVVRILRKLETITAQYEFYLSGPKNFTSLLGQEDLTSMCQVLKPPDIIGATVVIEGLPIDYDITHTLDVGYSACGKYSINLPGLSASYGRAKYFLDQLGLNLDFAIAWNAIPCSFVIDWFLDVGDWLHSYARSWTKIDISHTAWINSLKIDLQRTLTIYPHDPLHPPPFHNAIAYVTDDYEAYYRNLFFHKPPPMRHRLKKSYGLDLNRAIISAALLRQRTSKYHMPRNDVSLISGRINSHGWYE